VVAGWVRMRGECEDKGKSGREGTERVVGKNGL
jgi:hypothetical protein